MAIVNMSKAVYNNCQNTFGRTVTFTSTLGNSYSGTNRGIYSSHTLNVVMEDGSIFSDQQTILDIRTDEFPTLPIQGDVINIPVDSMSDTPAAGSFEITNVFHNGGGEITLELKAIVT
jgi:hypothetical protein